MLIVDQVEKLQTIYTQRPFQWCKFSILASAYLTYISI